MKRLLIILAGFGLLSSDAAFAMHKGRTAPKKLAPKKGLTDAQIARLPEKQFYAALAKLPESRQTAVLLLRSKAQDKPVDLSKMSLEQMTAYLGSGSADLADQAAAYAPFASETVEPAAAPGAGAAAAETDASDPDGLAAQQAALRDFETAHAARLAGMSLEEQRALMGTSREAQEKLLAEVAKPVGKSAPRKPSGAGRALSPFLLGVPAPGTRAFYSAKLAPRSRLVPAAAPAVRRSTALQDTAVRRILMSLFDESKTSVMAAVLLASPDQLEQIKAGYRRVYGALGAGGREREQEALKEQLFRDLITPIMAEHGARPDDHIHGKYGVLLGKIARLRQDTREMGSAELGAPLFETLQSYLDSLGS